MELNDDESVLAMLKEISTKLSIQQDGNTEKDLAWKIFNYYQDQEDKAGSKEKTSLKREQTEETTGICKKQKRTDYQGLDFFPLQSVPDTALKCILKHLDLTDKLNMRLLCRWFGVKVKYVEPSVRKWKIRITEENQADVLLRLKKAKSDSSVLRHDINIGLYYKKDQQEIMSMLIKDWGQHITGFKFVILKDDNFLLDDVFKFPNLQDLHLQDSPFQSAQEVQQDESCCSFNHELVDHDLFSKICSLKKTMIERHASTLTKLTVSGEWNLDVDTQLPVIQCLGIRTSTFKTLNSLYKCCKNSLTTIDISNCYEFDTRNSDLFFPNVEHILLDECSTAWFKFVNLHRSQVVTLKIEAVTMDDSDVTGEFPAIKYLWVDQCTALIDACSQTIECLITADLSDGYARKLPNIKDVYIFDNDEETNIKQFLDSNSESIEFLFVSRDKTSFYNGIGIEDVENKFLSLKTIILPGCINDSLVNLCLGGGPVSLTSPYRSERVLTLKKDVNRTVYWRAKGKYPFPDIAPYINDDCEIR